MRHRQRGIATVEFAIGSTAFFIVLFAIVEIGRALFTWNGLTEATRRGARVAAVCPVNHTAIKRVALFDNPGSSGRSPVLSGLAAEHVQVAYLDENGAVIASPAGSAGFAAIRYVRVAITGYQHPLLIPFVNLTLTAPDLAATIPRESLGIPRDGAAAACFGSAI